MSRRLSMLLILLPLAGCTPPPPIPAPANKTALHSVLTGIMLNPDVTCAQLRAQFELFHLQVVDDPGEAGLEFEEHFVTTADEHVLRVWYLPTALDRGTVVVSMGAVGEMACYLFTGRLLARNGWSVVMYEYRGFGGSSGRPEISMMDTDLEAVVDWTRAFTGREKVTVHGISIGTIPSVAVAVRRPDAVNAVVLDSPVALGQMIDRFEFVLREQTALFNDLVDRRLLSERIIHRQRQPLLIFVGEDDLLTTPASIELMFQRAGAQNKVLSRFSGSGHARGRFDNTAQFTVELERFLAGAWGQIVNEAPVVLDP